MSHDHKGGFWNDHGHDNDDDDDDDEDDDDDDDDDDKDHLCGFCWIKRLVLACPCQ